MASTFGASQVACTRIAGVLAAAPRPAPPPRRRRLAFDAWRDAARRGAAGEAAAALRVLQRRGLRGLASFSAGMAAWRALVAAVTGPLGLRQLRRGLEAWVAAVRSHATAVRRTPRDIAPPPPPLPRISTHDAVHKRSSLQAVQALMPAA